MTKFHINPETGDVGKCSAAINCPFGSVSDHYDSADDARGAAEEQLNAEYGGSFGQGKKEKAEEPVEDSPREEDEVREELSGVEKKLDRIYGAGFGRGDQSADALDAADKLSERRDALKSEPLANGSTLADLEIDAAREAADDLDGVRIGDNLIREAEASDDGKEITLRIDPNAADPLNPELDEEAHAEIDALLQDEGDEFYALSEEDAETRADELATKANENYHKAYLSGSDSHAADSGAGLVEEYSDRGLLADEKYEYKVEFDDYNSINMNNFMDKWEQNQED